MKIQLKNREQINKLQASAELLFSWLSETHEVIAAGHIDNGMQLEEDFRDFLKQHDAEPLFDSVQYDGCPDPYGSLICVSIDDQACHSRPTSEPFKDGSLISVDAGLKLDGWCADQCISAVYNVYNSDHLERNKKALDLIVATKATLEAMTIQAAVKGATTKDISNAGTKYATVLGYTMIQGYAGHGIGRAMHEPPMVTHHDEILPVRVRPGMVLCLEPMLSDSESSSRVMDADGWRCMTTDGKIVCHEEITVAIEEDCVRCLGPTGSSICKPRCKK